MTTSSLLPPNATPLERGLEAGTTRLGAVEAPVAPLLDPWTCPIDLLPWLAWGLSVDSWDADWSEATKRAAVANSIELHRMKGTRRAVETVLSRFDDLAELVEWHEAAQARDPNTFEVTLPMVTAGGVAEGGKRATAAFAEAMIREIGRVKPLREHLTMVQSVTAGGFVGVQGVARVFAETRQDLALTPDTSPLWSLYLQTEDGEPLQDSDGAFWDTAR